MLTHHLLRNPQSLDESRQTASRLWGPRSTQLFRPGGNSYPRLQAAKLSSIYLASIDTRGAIRIQSPAEHNKTYTLYVVEKGRLEIELSGGSYTCDPAILAIVPARENLTIRTDEVAQFRCIAIPADVLESTLSAFLNRPLVRQVSFFPLIASTRPGVEALLHLVEYLFQQFDRADTLRMTAPLAFRQLEKTFVAQLLETVPHNYSGELTTGPGSAVPWYVRFCEEHIKAHLDEPLSMSDLAAAVKVSARTIHEGFRRHRAYSPMEFRRRLRLERVRAELLDPNLRRTVTEVGMGWCFWHLGRFSKDYFRAFGERPSETLSRSRNNRITDKLESVKSSFASSENLALSLLSVGPAEPSH